jgi:hypothetical protein
MDRAPLTRQRSKWMAIGDRPDALEALAGLGADSVDMWWRNVHDGQLRCIVTEEPMGWHLSISHSRRVRGGDLVPGRYPTWDEIADARDEFLPAAAAFVMHLPTLDEYVAVHDTTFHLHEHPERAR